MRERPADPATRPESAGPPAPRRGGEISTLAWSSGPPRRTAACARGRRPRPRPNRVSRLVAIASASDSSRRRGGPSSTGGHLVVDQAVVDGRARSSSTAGRLRGPCHSSTSTSNGCVVSRSQLVHAVTALEPHVRRARSGRHGGRSGSLPGAADDRVAHAGGPDVGCDVVHADDVDAGGDAQRGRRERRLEPLVRRQVEHLAQRRLARRAEQDRPAERRPARRRPRSSSRFWSGRLPEADAGVDDDRAARGRPPRQPARRRPAGRRRPRRRRRRRPARPRLCITISGTPRAAASRARASSGPTPQMSLTASAPASSAAAATAVFVVSMVSGVSGNAARTAATTGTTRRQLVGVARPAAWPGRVDSPPTSSRSAPSSTIRRAWATAAADGVAGREQPVAGERIGRHVEDAHHVRAAAPGEGGRADRVGSIARPAVGGSAWAVRRGSSGLVGRVAQQRVVDQPGADGPDKIERAGHDDRAARACQRPVERLGRRSAVDGRRRPAGRAARQRAASSSAGMARAAGRRRSR